MLRVAERDQMYGEYPRRKTISVIHKPMQQQHHAIFQTLDYPRPSPTFFDANSVNCFKENNNLSRSLPVTFFMRRCALCQRGRAVARAVAPRYVSSTHRARSSRAMGMRTKPCFCRTRRFRPRVLRSSSIICASSVIDVFGCLQISLRRRNIVNFSLDGANISS